MKSSSELVKRARAEIVGLPVGQAVKLLNDRDTIFVDLRDSVEISNDGTIPGAVQMPRGNLEFWIDPASDYFKPIFGQKLRFVFFCAADLRSTLATCTAQEMGLQNVAHLEGGFAAWRAAGAPVDAAPQAIEQAH